jgi:hypothetical protein
MSTLRLPDFLRPWVNLYFTPLLIWFSDYVYDQLLRRHADPLLVTLHHRFDFRPLEQACAAFHHASGPGSPVTHSVPRLVRALLVKYLFGWSLRQLEIQLRFNLVVKWFVGYAVFDAGPDHSSLERFEQWVGEHQPRLFFDTALRRIDADFPELRARPQIGDTFALRANAAKESLLPLIRHTCRRLLTALLRAAPDRHAAVVAALDRAALFGSVDEVDEAFLPLRQRAARLRATVTAAWQCARLIRDQLATVPPLAGSLRAEVDYWLAHLDKLFADELELVFAAPGQPVPIELEGPRDLCDEQNAFWVEIGDVPPDAPTDVLELPKDQKGAYRLGSATDPDATYRQHGPGKTDFGYNVQVFTDGDFVREIQPATGAQPDAASLPDLLTTQHQHHGFFPEKLIYDAAAGHGKPRALVEQATYGQTQLVAPLPPHDHRADHFGPEHFTLSAGGATLTCPNHQTSEVAYRHGSGEGRSFRFFSFQCQDCPLWKACRGEAAGPRSMRQVFVSDYRAQTDAARAYNRTPAFKQDMKLRPLVERIIAGLVRYNDARRARRRGLPRADFQEKMCATAFNLKTWVRRLARRGDMLAAQPA